MWTTCPFRVMTLYEPLGSLSICIPFPTSLRYFGLFGQMHEPLRACETHAGLRFSIYFPQSVAFAAVGDTAHFPAAPPVAVNRVDLRAVWIGTHGSLRELEK